MSDRCEHYRTAPGDRQARRGDEPKRRCRARFVRLATALWSLAGAVQGHASPPPVGIQLPGGASMSFRWVPPGELVIGGARRLPNESTDLTRRVRLSRGFYLADTEITQGQWFAVMGAQPWADKPHVVDDPSRPAVFFSWTELQDYVERLGALSGRRLRLPTEAEWEHACRAGAAAPDSSGLHERAWLHDNTFGAGQPQAQPVATRRANPWGFHDMVGNVWEWVADWYSPTYGIAAEAPVAVDPRGPAHGTHRVKRGGSFFDAAVSQHCGARDGYAEAGRFVNIGARLVLDPEERP